DAQSRLLLSKASAYGLEQRQAYEIISDYTLSAHSTDEALKRLLLAETFKQDDIDKIVSDKATSRPARRKSISTAQVVPDWLRNLAMLVVGVGILGFLGYWIYGQFSTSSHSPGYIERQHPEDTVSTGPSTPPPSHNQEPPPAQPEAARPRLKLQPDPP